MWVCQCVLVKVCVGHCYRDIIYAEYTCLCVGWDFWMSVTVLWVWGEYSALPQGAVSATLIQMLPLCQFQCVNVFVLVLPETKPFPQGLGFLIGSIIVKNSSGLKKTNTFSLCPQESVLFWGKKREAFLLNSSALCHECDWGAEVEWLTSERKVVNSVLTLPARVVEVSLGKTFDLPLLPVVWLAHCMAALSPCMWMCACMGEWNWGCLVFLAPIRIEKQHIGIRQWPLAGLEVNFSV